MSAIAGLYHPLTPKPVDPARIAQMRDAMAHRGSDGASVWTASGVGLGHRLHGGPAEHAQPAVSPEGDVVAMLDGAIGNAGEVRRALEAKGARFAGEGDAELLLHGWRLWGPMLLERLAGAFALAIYDARRRSLFLARDRFGAKPLVYAELSDGGLAFASEIGGLLAHPLLRRAPDLRAIEDYLGLGYVPDQSALLGGVKKLPAAHCLLLERGRPVPAPVRWWDLDFSNPRGGKPKDLAAELAERMRGAVRSHTRSDAEVGALLSGGVNSGAVVALMAEASKGAVVTCTVGGQPQATAVAERFATDHLGRPFETVPAEALAAAFDEPVGDPAAMLELQAARLAASRVRVALGGQGGAELFAGHRRYRTFALSERARSLLPSRFAGGGEFAYPGAVCVTPPALRQSLFTDAARKVLGGHSAEQHYADAMRQAPASSALDRAQYADLRHALPAKLARFDRLGMAAGVEVRAPLIDHGLAEFAASLPPSLRMRMGQGQWLMKKAMEPYLPRDMLYRRSSERALGTVLSAEMLGEADGLGSARMLTGTGWFDSAAIERLVADQRAGRTEHARTLWLLIMLDRSLNRLFG